MWLCWLNVFEKDVYVKKTISVIDQVKTLSKGAADQTSNQNAGRMNE